MEMNNYTSKSTYNAQLIGSYCTFNANAIWREKNRRKALLLRMVVGTREVANDRSIGRKELAMQPNLPAL